MLDLSAIRVVDNHCHPILKDQAFTGVSWRRLFSEAEDPTMPERHVPCTVFYRRLIRSMAARFGCDPTEDAVLAARSARDIPHLLESLGNEAQVDALIIDTGFPQGEHVLPNDRFANHFGSRYAEILRLELLFQDLVRIHPTLESAREALAHELRDVRASGYAGVKSIVGYRTGLDVRTWTRDEADQAYRQARNEVAQKGRVRLGFKPLLDTLLRDALQLAASQNLPAQFHVGYGDPDVDLRQATPLHLRSLIEDPAMAGLQFVLLHACWPYFREGAFLATVYPNVVLDLSYAIPFFGIREYVTATRAALAVAPWTKIVFSSDAGRVPELHWMGAIDGRRAVGEAVSELVRDGDLTHDEALNAATCILHDNAAALYGLRPSGVA